MNFAYRKQLFLRIQQKFGPSQNPIELVIGLGGGGGELILWGFDMTWMEGKKYLECGGQSLFILAHCIPTTHALLHDLEATKPLKIQLTPLFWFIPM